MDSPEMNDRLILCYDCEIEKTSALCTKHGLGIEIQSFYHPDNYSDENIALHKTFLSKINLRSIHGPYGDLCPGSFDNLLREVARKRFIQASKVATDLGINNMILHNGYVPNTSYIKNYVKRAVIFWKELLAEIDSGLSIYIENHLENDPAIMMDIVDEIANNRFGINIDIGHINFSSKMSVVDWIRKCNKRIKYFHLHDNNGTRDEHVAFGKGNIPFNDVFHAIKEYCDNPLMAIETQSDQLEESILWINEYCT